MRSALDQIWPRLAAVAGIIVVWALVHRSGYFNRLVLPSPLEVWHSLLVHVGDGTIPRATTASLARLGVGFLISVASGTLLGLLLVASKIMQRSVGSLIIGLQSLPSIAWIPLGILWFGFNERATLFVVIIGSFPAVALATAASFRQIPPLYERAGRTLGAKGWRLYRSVVFPAAVPGYVTGLQQGWAFAWRSLMAGELIVSSSLGLGKLLHDSQQNLETAEVLAVMAVIIAIGMIVDLMVFGVADRRIRAKRGLLAEA